ncbi:hypothetical protein HQ312_14645 [Rhodococcus sp. BP-316]|uniref:hypothetical protein n=1 Tax=Rhodococcus sp. BP-316 TaxID=2739445 RepID=UPI001C9B51EB|nr:hypothetical protein [Rhodococcus sp. BP-316]MBY6682293.1 hypothetical protein [Rhodococcus sp. BP-316]
MASVAEYLKLVVHAPVAPIPELSVAQPSALFESTHIPTGFEFCCNQLMQVTEPVIVPAAASAGTASAIDGAMLIARTAAIQRNLLIVFSLLRVLAPFIGGCTTLST